MQLELKTELPAKAAHYYNAFTGDILLSDANRFYGECHGRKFSFRVPIPLLNWLSLPSQTMRRAARTNAASAVFNFCGDGVVIAYQGCLFFYDILHDELHETGHLKNCNCVLFGGISVSENGIYIGEYGRNPGRLPVPVWISRDEGRTWNMEYEFPAGSIRHIHGIYSDPIDNGLWIPTGDFEGECFLYQAKDCDFNSLLQYGDGKQEWRHVGLFQRRASLVWVMDSELQTSYLQKFDKASQTLSQGRAFPGPVWYVKSFSDNAGGLVQTTVEVGTGVHSQSSHVFYSPDLESWSEVSSFRKDWLPAKYFKSGVVGFAPGPQTTQDFLIFGEALCGMDGRVYSARLVE